MYLMAGGSFIRYSPERTETPMTEEEKMMKLNWKKTSGVVLAMGALLLMAVVGFSQHGGPQGPHPPGRGFRGGPGGPGGDLLGHLSRELNLTEEQKAQIKKIMDSAEESTKAWREQ